MVEAADVTATGRVGRFGSDCRLGKVDRLGDNRLELDCKDIEH